MQNLRRLILIFLLITGSVFADEFRMVSWNLQWFPGKKLASSEAERAVHMSEARDTLIELRPDVLCLQEVRDQPSMNALVEILPGFTVHIVSRFRSSFGGGIGIQQVAIGGTNPAESAWAEEFVRGPVDPPRGFVFSAIPTSSGYLLVYSVHLKSNIGDPEPNIAKREESARQLVRHATEMEAAYGKAGKVSVVLAGDFNTDPTQDRFREEQTAAILQKAGFQWCWDGIPLEDRVTLPAKGKYPDASFDGFFYRGCRMLSVNVVDTGEVSDHRPVVLTVSTPD